MKIRNLLVLLLTVFVVACVNNDIDSGNQGDDKGEVVEPSYPDEPAYIKFGCKYVFADYDGGVRTLTVDVNPDWEWEITTSGEWFSAERVENDLVVTFSESEDKLERKGAITVKVDRKSVV